MHRAREAAGDTGAVLDADERAELERLRRENAELRLDRGFLKKPATFVVSEPTHPHSSPESIPSPIHSINLSGHVTVPAEERPTRNLG